MFSFLPYSRAFPWACSRVREHRNEARVHPVTVGHPQGCAPPDAGQGGAPYRTNDLDRRREVCSALAWPAGTGWPLPDPSRVRPGPSGRAGSIPEPEAPPEAPSCLCPQRDGGRAAAVPLAHGRPVLPSFPSVTGGACRHCVLVYVLYVTDCGGRGASRGAGPAPCKGTVSIDVPAPGPGRLPALAGRGGRAGAWPVRHQSPDPGGCDGDGGRGSRAGHPSWRHRSPCSWSSSAAGSCSRR